MTLNLTPDTTLDKIKSFYDDESREKARKSDARLRRLQNLAGWLTDPGEIKVEFSHSQAECWQKEDGTFGIHVPKSKQSQVETDIDAEKWDWLFQKTELVHELGHVLYTDFSTLREYTRSDMEGHPDVDDPELFKEMFNAAEDGAIERQLGEAFNVTNDLAIKNANLFGQPLSFNRFNAREAIHFLLLEWAKYDTGRAEILLDPAKGPLFFGEELFPTTDAAGNREYVVSHLGQIRDYAEAMLTEPVGDVRVDATMSFYETVLEPLEHQQAGNPYQNPEDMVDGSEARSEGERADELEKDAEDSDDEEPDEKQAEGDVTVGTGGGGDADLSAERGEAKAMVRSMDRADVDVTLTVPDSRYGDEERHDDAEKRGKRLARIFRQRLQKVQKTKRQSGHRSGRVDKRSMRKLRRGNTRVFTKESKPDRPDFNVIFVGDRSGSMAGSDVRQMESSVGSLVYGLEGVDVDTSVLSFEGTRVYLDKPFGADVGTHAGNLFSATTGGGTPMHRALEVARARLQTKPGKSFIVVVTDGYPDNRSAYLDELKACSVPVLGVTIGGASETVDANPYYDYSTAISSSDELGSKLRMLAEHFIV